MKKKDMIETSLMQMRWARKSAQEKIENIRYNVGMLTQDLKKYEQRINNCPETELLKQVKYFKDEMKTYKNRLGIESLENLISNVSEYDAFLRLIKMMDEEEE